MIERLFFWSVKVVDDVFPDGPHSPSSTSNGSQAHDDDDDDDAADAADAVGEGGKEGSDLVVGGDGMEGPRVGRLLPLTAAKGEAATEEWPSPRYESIFVEVVVWLHADLRLLLAAPPFV
jgi:hypothetical protein